MSIANLRNRVAILRRDVDRMKRGAGTVKWGNILGRPGIGTGSGQIAPGNLQTLLGLAGGTPGSRYRIVACVIRNTGSGFEFISDAGHVPVGVTSVNTTSTAVTVNLSFTASRVGAAIAVPDETFAQAGYVFGPSVGLSSIVIYASRPSAFADYISYNGTSWQSLNGLISNFSFDAASGYLTCTHQSLTPIGGSFTSRSLTNRGVLDSMGDTTTRLAWVNSSGVTVKTPSTDLRGWITRAGATTVDPTTLTLPNSNIWVLGVMEL